MVKKLNFVKENKTIVRSSHPPLDMFIINYKGTEIKVSPIKIVEIIDANTPISVEKKKRLLNKTILLIIPYILLANNSTVLKKKLKNLLLQKLKNL